MVTAAVTLPIAYANIRALFKATLPALGQAVGDLAQTHAARAVFSKAHFAKQRLVETPHTLGGSSEGISAEVERRLRVEATTRGHAAAHRARLEMIRARHDRGAVAFGPPGTTLRSGKVIPVPPPNDPDYVDNVKRAISSFDKTKDRNVPGAHPNMRDGVQTPWRETCGLLEFQSKLDGPQMRPDFLYAVAELCKTAEGFHAVKTCFEHDLAKHPGCKSHDTLKKVQRLLARIPIVGGEGSTVSSVSVKTLLVLIGIAAVSTLALGTLAMLKVTLSAPAAAVIAKNTELIANQTAGLTPFQPPFPPSSTGVVPYPSPFTPLIQATAAAAVAGHAAQASVFTIALNSPNVSPEEFIPIYTQLADDITHALPEPATALDEYARSVPDTQMEGAIDALEFGSFAYNHTVDSSEPVAQELGKTEEKAPNPWLDKLPTIKEWWEKTKGNLLVLPSVLLGGVSTM
jgi:hypothetical protein